MEEKMEALEMDLRNELEKKQDITLDMMRKKLGELGGAGHYFENDGHEVRDSMEKKDLKKVLQLLSLGEKRINLKEKEFRDFLNVKNGEKLKKSFCIITIGRSPRLDGRSSSRLLGELEEMENISIFGFQKKVKIKI